MKELLKPIFEWLTSNYYLFDNAIYNYFAMALVGLVALIVAWNSVGFLYNHDLISGRISGSIIHWLLRFIAFIVIFTIISSIIGLVRFILSIPTWIWLVLGAIIIVSTTFIFIRCLIRRDRRYK